MENWVGMFGSLRGTERNLLVTRDRLKNCIGSSKYKICHETLATENKD